MWTPRGTSWSEPEDIDAAFEELDARYLVGEAAVHAHMWSATVGGFSALNRHELPVATPDYGIIDHQLQHSTVSASAIAEYLDASWDLRPDFRSYIEAVHQLTDRGAVVTYAARETSQDGFDAEWRMVFIYMLDGDKVSRCEIFDDTDIAAALVRFDELSLS